MFQVVRCWRFQQRKGSRAEIRRGSQVPARWRDGRVRQGRSFIDSTDRVTESGHVRHVALPFCDEHHDVLSRAVGTSYPT
jgi:hypothetical protein